MTMTTNSPNPVDGDVQALTEKERIEQVEVVSSLIEKIVSDCANGWTAERDYILPLQIALAALTADPVYQLIDDSKWYDAPKYLFDEAKARGDECRIVYTNAPAQLLRPVELPDCEYGAVSHMSGGSKDYCNGFVDGTNNAIKAIREAGYEVKS